MFTKRFAEKDVSDSMIGAVNSVLDEAAKSPFSLHNSQHYLNHVKNTPGKTYLEKAIHHGPANLHHVISDLEGERHEIASHHGYKAAMLHDFAIRGFKASHKHLVKEELTVEEMELIEGRIDDLRDKQAAKKEKDESEYKFKEKKKDTSKTTKVTGTYGKTHKEPDLDEGVDLSEMTILPNGHSHVVKHANAIGADHKSLSDEHRKIVGERIRKDIGAKRVHVTPNGSVFHEGGVISFGDRLIEHAKKLSELKDTGFTQDEPNGENVGKDDTAEVVSDKKKEIVEQEVKPLPFASNVNPEKHVPGKAGSNHTPMSRVRHLAKMAMKHVQAQTQVTKVK